jgi:uncharacterized protein YebE (UPF0316 family)
MFSDQFLQTDLYNWAILPLLIFLGRSCDVTLATLRNIFLSRGIKKIVPLIGFFEVLIWLLAISSIIKNLHNVLCYVAFAGGYSMGIVIGIKIEERLALGTQLIRIITNKKSAALMDALRASNMGVTEIDALGSQGPVKVLLIIAKRKDLTHIMDIVNTHHGSAFFTIEDIRSAEQGIFPLRDGESKMQYFRRIFPVFKTAR